MRTSSAQKVRKRSRSTPFASASQPAAESSAIAAATASMSDQSSAPPFVFFSKVPRWDGMKSLTVPSYRLPSGSANSRASMEVSMSSTLTYKPRFSPLTDTAAKLQRGAGCPAAAKAAYERHVPMSDSSCRLLFSVRRSKTPPSVCPSAYLSNLILSDGLTSLLEPTNPFLRTPTWEWDSPSTVTSARNHV